MQTALATVIGIRNQPHLGLKFPTAEEVKFTSILACSNSEVIAVTAVNVVVENNFTSNVGVDGNRKVLQLSLLSGKIHKIMENEASYSEMAWRHRRQIMNQY